MSESGIRRNAPAADSAGCVPGRGAGAPAGSPLRRRMAGGAGKRVQVCHRATPASVAARGVRGMAG